MSVHDRQRRTGDAILDRLEQLEIPASLRSNVRTFRTAHNELILAISGFDNAKVACAEALATIKVADAALDRAVRILAARIVGAELGARSNPFARLSRHTPSQLQKLGYATEINEVRKLVGRLVQSKPPASVQKAANECLRLAGEVESAIGSLAEPQARQQRALQVRQAAGRDWQKQLRRLRLGAAMAWVNEPAVYRALFAAPRSLIGRGKKPRKRKIAMP